MARSIDENTVIPLLVLLGLYGFYLMLVTLAAWASFQRFTQLAGGIRVVVALMFIVVTTHTALQLALVFAPKNLSRSSLRAFPIMLNVTPCLSAFLSDGIVAWRCWVVWGRIAWFKWGLMFATTAGALIGISSAFAHAAGYSNEAASLLVVWDWWYFIVNTCMTASIFGKIARLCLAKRRAGIKGSRCFTLFRASVESSIISWLALMAYGIWNVRIDRHMDLFTPDMTRGRAGFTLLPAIFGISQCLIVARIGISRYIRWEQSDVLSTLRLGRGDACDSTGECTMDLTFSGACVSSEQGWEDEAR